MDKKADVAAEPVPASVPQTSETQRAGPPDNPSLNALEAEIAAIRHETLLTINALGRRLSPSRLKAEIGNRARQATLGRARRMAEQTSATTKRWSATVFERLKDHPLSALLLAGGLGWLIAGGVRRQDRAQEREAEGFYERRKAAGTDSTGTYGVGFIERRRAAVGGIDKGFYERRKTSGTDPTGTYGLGFIDRRRSGIGGIDRTSGREQAPDKEITAGGREKAEEAREKAARVAERAGAGASQVRAQLRQKVEGIGDSVRRAQQRVRGSGRSAKESVFRSLERNPVAGIAAIVAIGTALGLIISDTRLEKEKLSRLGDRVRDRGREQAARVKAGADAVLRQAGERAAELLGRERAERTEPQPGSAAQEIRDKLAPFP